MNNNENKKGKTKKEYDVKTLAFILFILLLCILDAYFTSFLMSFHAVETNPVMSFFMKWGHLEFIFAKYIITVICLVVVLVSGGKDYIGNTGIKKNTIFYVITGFYSIVLAWELILVSIILF